MKKSRWIETEDGSLLNLDWITGICLLVQSGLWVVLAWGEADGTGEGIRLFASQDQEEAKSYLRALRDVISAHTHKEILRSRLKEVQMNIQDATIIAAVLTQYEKQFSREGDGSQTPIAQLMEKAFPKYQWVWNPVVGRYEVLMGTGDGLQVRGVLEAKEG